MKKIKLGLLSLFIVLTVLVLYEVDLYRDNGTNLILVLNNLNDFDSGHNNIQMKVYVDDQLTVNDSVKTSGLVGKIYNTDSHFGRRKIIVEIDDLKQELFIYNYLVTWVWISYDDATGIHISYKYSGLKLL